MADTPATDKLVRAEPEGFAPDPITSRSTSGVLLVCALLLMASLAWALWDEVSLTRPWKGDQQTFVKRYKRYLNRIRAKGFKTEIEVQESAEYKALADEARAAKATVKPQVDENNRRIKTIDTQLAAISDPFQDTRGRITVASYEVEQAHDDRKAEERKDVEELKNRKIKIAFPADDGAGKAEREFDYVALEKTYTGLKEEKGRLLASNGELLKESQELERKRDDYLKDNVTEVTREQVRLLNNKLDNFTYGIRQINVNGDELVDRCETCHLGIREPIPIKASDMMARGKRPDRMARAFTSHPSRELLQIHDPERFGCASCHWGNGRATTSIAKGHGQHRFWLHPLFEKENMEAGCNQCHAGDRVLQGAPKLTEGKDLFSERGCVGCHRYEGFDRETDALTNTRQLIKQFDDQVVANEREARAARAESSAAGVSDEQAQRLLARSESLIVTNSQIESRRDELETQARYLMQDQKKVGPNLKDIRLKLRKEWVPVWLKDPQAFRPGTKMPTYWYLSGDEKMVKGNIVPARQQDEERKAIAAYLWQSAFEGQVATQPKGDAGRGKELFEVTGCMACHSLGQGEQEIGGQFAANLTRVGEKANYDYIVRWVHNPRERWAPYCPKHKRDLTPEDYAKRNKPYVFDTKNSRCPEDGAELQVQNMTVMPNFRLSDQDARDIATYLVSLSANASFPDASFMDDPKLKDQGGALIKQYGCAGCHEIRGFEDEQRIGKELTAEGATPLERLDFAMLTHKAEFNEDPLVVELGREGKKADPNDHNGWYDHKGFFEHKLADPSIYDMGKEKEPREHLRMPKPYLKPEWRTALTTFLLGSVGSEGANVPTSYFYKPTEQQKAIQDGWWIIKKYNCMGCHNVQVGQSSILSGLPAYQEGGALGKEQLPPGLMTEGARVDPDWLLRFLTDPSLNGGALVGREPAAPGQVSGANQALAARTPQGANGMAADAAPSGQAGPLAANANPHAGLKPQPGANRNGVRTYLKARMPTFSFSPNELRTLVRFFLAVSAQQEPYIKEQLDPLTEPEMNLARALFTSQAAPCLKCHITSEGQLDKTAPNFLDAGQRLKPDWTYRWLLDPQRIMPGTAMPSELFKREGERWVFNGPLPPTASEYQGDHARLLVRYLLQLTPEEQARSARTVPSAPAAAAPAAAATPPAPVASRRRGNAPRARGERPGQNAGRRVERRGRRQQASWSAPPRGARRRARGKTSVAAARPRPLDFSR